MEPKYIKIFYKSGYSREFDSNVYDVKPDGHWLYVSRKYSDGPLCSFDLIAAYSSEHIDYVVYP